MPMAATAGDFNFSDLKKIRQEVQLEEKGQILKTGQEENHRSLHSCGLFSNL